MIISSTVLGLVQKNPYIRKVLGRCSKAQMGELTGSWCLFPALCCSTFAIVGELLAVSSNTNTTELLLDEFQPSASRQRGSLDCCVLFCRGGEQVCHFPCFLSCGEGECALLLMLKHRQNSEGQLLPAPGTSVAAWWKW